MNQDTMTIKRTCQCAEDAPILANMRATVSGEASMASGARR